MQHFIIGNFYYFIGEKQYKCHLCDKSVATASHLKYHINSTHKGEKNFECDKCDKSYFESQALKRHVQAVHEGRRDYPCDFCGKCFITSQHLKVHIKNESCRRKNGGETFLL